MQTLFKIIYESLCGKNQNIPEYRGRIYGSVGLLTLLIAIVISLLFYLALGRWRNVWHTRTHWVITIVLAALTGFVLAYGVSKGIIGTVDSYLILFSMINAALLSFYFILLSFVFKNFSIYSKRTPF
jgi:hypothetical protein